MIYNQSFPTESEELKLVTELEDDGEDLVVKIFHLFLRSPQPLKFIVWDLKGTRAESILGVSCCQYFTFPSPNMISEQSMTDISLNTQLHCQVRGILRSYS